LGSLLEDKDQHDILLRSFGYDVTYIGDYIKYLILSHFNDLDLLKYSWILVKFTNYRSKKFAEEFSGYICVNSEHPFTSLLLTNLELIKQNEILKMKIQIFFKSFESITNAKLVEMALESQLDVLYELTK